MLMSILKQWMGIIIIVRMIKMAKILFAPDGQHFQVMKKGSIDKLWDYFNFNMDIRQQIALNRFAIFRLIGDQGKTIGELPRKN